VRVFAKPKVRRNVSFGGLQAVNDRPKSIGERLYELAVHVAEGRIGTPARDISHHLPGCPCERHLLERMQKKG